MPTPKQTKLIKLLLENLGSKGKTKTLGELVLEAGYEKSMAKNPYQILESETIKEGMSDMVNELEKQRVKALKRLNETVDKASYRDAIDAIDKLTKNIQLLGGKPTEIIENDYSQLTDEELARIAKGKTRDS